MKRSTVLSGMLMTTLGRFCCAFVVQQRAKIMRQPRLLATTSNDRSEKWMREGLLISSFSDGVLPNPEAQDLLRRGLIRSLLRQEQRKVEESIRSSAQTSPCCGTTDLVALDLLPKLDQALHELPNHPDPLQLLQHITEKTTNTPLRLVFIPTAMYALRPESNNTPGKQRQRARADGKKRRNEIVDLIQRLLVRHDDDNNNSSSSTCSVQVVTFDLDDGSVKQPEGGIAESFPCTGKEALQTWNPHLVYIAGGNTFWLHHCMTAGNWEDDLRAVATNSSCFLVGASAGAILAGSTIQTACWKGWDDPRVVPGMTDYQDWSDVPGLSLVGQQAFFPHMDESWESTVREKAALLRDESAVQVCALPDSAVCYVNGDVQETRILYAPAPASTEVR